MMADSRFQGLDGLGVVLVDNAGDAFGPELAIIFIAVHIIEEKDARILFFTLIGGNDVGAIESQKGLCGFYNSFIVANNRREIVTVIPYPFAPGKGSPPL